MEVDQQRLGEGGDLGIRTGREERDDAGPLPELLGVVAVHAEAKPDVLEEQRPDAGHERPGAAVQAVELGHERAMHAMQVLHIREHRWQVLDLDGQQRVLLLHPQRRPHRRQVRRHHLAQRVRVRLLTVEELSERLVKAQQRSPAVQRQISPPQLHRSPAPLEDEHVGETLLLLQEPRDGRLGPRQSPQGGGRQQAALGAGEELRAAEGPCGERGAEERAAGVVVAVQGRAELAEELGEEGVVLGREPVEMEGLLLLGAAR